MGNETILLFLILGISLILLLALIGLSRISNKVRNFFWFCSGVNISLLEQCSSDFNRYANIGATIFFTALLAWVSMAYALNSVFESLIPSIAFGFIWSLMIFTLDRTIVSSMQKPSQEVTYKEFEFWRESVFALIRLGVAVIISLVIMKPLEIKIFEDRLVAEIKNMGDEQAKLDSIASERNYGLGVLTDEIESARIEKGKLEDKKKQKPPTQTYKVLEGDYKACNQLLTQVQDNNNPKINQNKVAIAKTRKSYTFLMDINGEMKWQLNSDGQKIITTLERQNEALKDEIESQKGKCVTINKKMGEEETKYITQINKDLGTIDTLITQTHKAKINARIKAGIQAKNDSTIRSISFKGTLVTQIEALGRLTAKDGTMRWVSLFIMFIFIAIETAPILAKLIAKRGEYDEKLDGEKYNTWITQQKAKSDKTAEIKRNVEEREREDENARQVDELKKQAHIEMSSRKIDLRRQKEFENNEALFSMISEAQIEIAELVVQQWKEQELQKLKNQNQSNGTQNNTTNT